MSSVRVMPQIDVIRPADPEETAGAFVAAAERIDGPTLLALTRQTVPMLNEIDVKLRREGVARGGYIAKKESGEARSDHSCPAGANCSTRWRRRKNWARARVSFRCPALSGSSAQSEKYREEVLPNECRRRVAIEAGVPRSGIEYVGLDGKVVGLHRFGMSAPGDQVMKEFGIDAQHVVEAAKSSDLGSHAPRVLVDAPQDICSGKVRDDEASSPAREARAPPEAARLAHVARAIFEAGEFLQEGQRDFADRPVALLGNDQFRFALLLRPRFLVFLVNLRPNEQAHQIGVLFDRSGFAQIAQSRFSSGTRFRVADSTARRR